MLSWIQRCWIVVLLAAAAAAGVLLHRAGAPLWVVLAAALLVVNVHAVLLALEFAWLASTPVPPGIPKAGALTLLKAWAGEVVTGLRVFGWRQPFRSRAWPDQPHAAPGQRGVLLVHGFVCNRGFWNPWLKVLRAQGIAHMAVNLEPVEGPIDRYVPTIEAAVAQLQQATGCAPIVVAHSMGGLAVRAWLRKHQADARVHSVITIASPHAGTAMARFALSPNTQQMRPSHPWLLALQRAETPARRRLFTCYYGHCDNIVFPIGTATLPDADNRHVSGTAHVELAFHRPILDEVLRRVRAAPHGAEGAGEAGCADATRRSRAAA